jgi:hypothetical protein
MDAGSNGLSPKIGQSGRGKGSEAAYLDKPGFLLHYISSRRQPGGRGAVSSQSTGQDSGLSKFLTQLIAAIGGLGILTYAILWFGYTRFYGHFHVPLRDVGLDYKAVLGQSATMIALLSLGALFGVGAAWLARSRMRWWAGIPLVLLASVAVGVLLGSLFVLNPDSTDELIVSGNRACWGLGRAENGLRGALSGVVRARGPGVGVALGFGRVSGQAATRARVGCRRSLGTATGRVGQVGWGMQRSRARANWKRHRHGQRAGRCRLGRRADRVSRPGKAR